MSPEPRTFELGRFMVVLRQEIYGQWLYNVYLGPVRIGKSVSIPDLGCCEWLYLQQREQTGYAYSTEKLTDKPYGFTAVHNHKRLRKRELAGA